MKKQREHWGSKIGFILAAAGSAIGIGTLWKFPYVLGENGGGVFLMFYLLFTFFIGVPVFIAELMLGRAAQRGPVGVFPEVTKDANTPWRIVGWVGVMAAFLMMSFYCVVSGWAMNYALLSVSGFYKGRTLDEIGSAFDALALSGDVTLFWDFLFLFITALVVYSGVRKGIEQWSKIMTSSLLVLLLGMLTFSLTLDGFPAAVSFIFTPDFSKFSPSGVLEALGLAFFTLSVAQGVMLAYGSYLRDDDDIPKTALIIGSMVIVVSVLVALMIFPIIFTFQGEVASGPGLVFKTLPLLFAQLPGSQILSTLFFIMFVFTALTSSVALLEGVVANSMDLYDWPRKKAVILIASGIFLLSIPCAFSGTGLLFSSWEEMYGQTFFDTMNQLVSIWLLPIGGFLMSIFVGWRLDAQFLRTEFNKGTRVGFLFAPWLFFVRWVAPAAMLIVLLQESGVIDLDRMFLSVFK
jgi:NSS family neurotransmitter:Na+ symporter